MNVKKKKNLNFPLGNKKAGFELSVNFIVILIICIVIFGFSIGILKKFFSHAETIKMTYDERTEQEIERLLDDGSRVAIPFDKKTIGNGEFKTFGIGILNTLNIGSSNEFQVNVRFNKAFNKGNDVLCSVDPPTSGSCGSPDTWLQTSTTANGIDYSGVTLQKTVKNNEQEKFLLGVSVKGAPAGTYVFDLTVCYANSDTEDPLHALTNSPECKCWKKISTDPNPVQYDIDTGCSIRTKDNSYDTLHKLYVDVP
ncbi:MAG: hypothetical protein KKC75_05780 [Nanoarchaeota archaeon]|nr:hypothetical protein [Nanoarchaeota archaeon]MBU1004914.1 hypothetical protein [Nanoarchaeota archaeon]MBU1945640.1 hypothetical protein [Nanoarchaeota archaeon]